MRISLLGGDERSRRLAALLFKDGHNVRGFGLGEVEVESLKVSNSLMATIKDSDIVIGPLPCSRDHVFLNAPLYDKKIKMEDIFKGMKKDQVFIAGGISKDIKKLANIYGISTVDIMDREELAILNAIPTAEAAIGIAMEKMDTTIHNSNIMILGFGRIGKLLAKNTQALGGNIFVGARKNEDFAWIKSYGFKGLHLNSIKSYLANMDLVFNTIPSRILTRENLLELKEDSVVIDLASKPGGVDFKAAEEMDIKLTWALGLPGKAAAQTSAEIIRESIYNIIEDLEV